MAAVLVSVLLLDTVVLPGVTIAGWRPDLVALSVVAFALADGPGAGARYGFAAGLASDLLAGVDALVGLSALVLLLLGHGAGVVRVYLAGTGVLGEMAVGALATAVAVIGYGLLGLLLGAGPLTVATVVEGGAVSGALNGLLAPFVIRPVRALSRRVSASLTGA